MRTPALLAAISLSLASGCATITRGSTDSWTVTSSPSGADVRLSSGETCKTPCTLKLRRKDPFTVDIHREGYEPVTTQIQSQTKGGGSAGMAGNVFLGGIIGAGVDAGTGAHRDLVPNPLHVDLQPIALEDKP